MMQHPIDQFYLRKIGGKARKARSQTTFVSSVISLSQRCKDANLELCDIPEVQQKATYSPFDVPRFTTPYEVALLSSVSFQLCHPPLGPLASILGPSLHCWQL